MGTVKNSRKRIKEDSNFLYKYINLIKNFDYESVKILNNIVSKISNYNDIEEEFYFNFYETKELTKFILEYSKKIKKLNKNSYSYDKYILPTNHFEP